jgi:hypothetical protein
MRKFILTVLGIVAVLAFTLYATIGETGPIGWINAAQARGDGTYSRAISAFVLVIGACLVVMGGIYVIEFVQKMRRAMGGPAAPQPVAAAAPIAAAVVTPRKPSMPAPSGWRLGLIVWATFMTLFWACLLGWYGWDWHLRRVDVVSAYAPLQLGRGVEPTRPGNGSHLALEGGVPMWDRALSRQTTNPSGSNRTEAIYVPVATADWRQGDPVHFVAQFGEVQQLYDLQRAAGDTQGPVLVRVDGGVPDVVRPVFQQHGVLVAENAVMVTAVMSQAGRPTQVDPPFDWMHVDIMGGIVTLLFTVLPLAAGLGVKRQEWMKRRREARAAGKTA